MTELKTLKDLTLTIVAKEEIKAEAIKWVKEDIIDFMTFDKVDKGIIFRRWMHRLSITEEDLK